MCPRTQGSEIDLEGGMETGTGKTLQMTLLVFISLVAFVMVGIEQGKEASMDRQVDTKEELQRLKKERLNQAASTSIKDGTTN